MLYCVPLSVCGQHPHMLVVGMYDGNIAVYNLQKNTGTPSYQSDAKNGKHRDIVWQVGTIFFFFDVANIFRNGCEC